MCWSGTGNSLNGAWDESIRVCGAHDRNVCQKYKKTNQSEEERDFWNWLECVLLKLEGFVWVCSHNIERRLMSGKAGNWSSQNGKILSVRYTTQFNLDFQCLLLCVYWRDDLAIIV